MYTLLGLALWFLMILVCGWWNERLAWMRMRRRLLREQRR